MCSPVMRGRLNFFERHPELVSGSTVEPSSAAEGETPEEVVTPVAEPESEAPPAEGP